MLDNSDLVLQGATDAAGYLNFGNPIATSVPALKGQASAGYHWKNYSLVSYLNYISSYEDRGSKASSNPVIRDLFSTVDPFITWDVSFLWTLSKQINFALSGVNLFDTRPPMANVEQAYDGFTHTPKGRKLKLAVTYHSPTKGRFLRATQKNKRHPVMAGCLLCCKSAISPIRPCDPPSSPRRRVAGRRWSVACPCPAAGYEDRHGGLSLLLMGCGVTGHFGIIPPPSHWQRGR